MTRAARCENQLSALVQVLAQMGGQMILDDAKEGLGLKDAHALQELFDYFDRLHHPPPKARMKR